MAADPSRYGRWISGMSSPSWNGLRTGSAARRATTLPILMQTAENAVEDNLPDYLAQLKGLYERQLLEELDDYNIEVIYKRLAANSVAYMLLSRCGLDADGLLSVEIFLTLGISTRLPP